MTGPGKFLWWKMLFSFFVFLFLESCPYFFMTHGTPGYLNSLYIIIAWFNS
jgi:hypothetical protein